MITSDEGDNGPNRRLEPELTPRCAVRSNLRPLVFLIVWLLPLAGLCFSPLLTGCEQATTQHRGWCGNNLKQLGIALQNYHDTFKCFPPAYLADKDGNPMHSWRVLILPYLEERTATAVYDQYRFDEPWNGPHNRLLADNMPPMYRDPDGPKTGPSYLAVVGSQSLWPADQCTSIKSIGDRTANTIAIVEVANSGIHWMEPRDLTFEQAMQGVNPPLTKMAISSIHPGGANSLFADGSTHFLSDKIPKNSLRGLLTTNGGELVSPDDEEKSEPDDTKKLTH